MSTQDWPTEVHVYTDGACRGNPGPSSVGVHFKDTSGETIHEIAQPIGETTNNVAEYTAVQVALETAHKHSVQNLSLFSDSELLVKQLNGIYKVKSSNLKELYQQCLKLSQNYDTVKFTHVRREYNKRADELANLALDRM